MFLSFYAIDLVGCILGYLQSVGHFRSGSHSNTPYKWLG